MRLTHQNGRSGTYRVALERAGEMRVDGGLNPGIFGNSIDRLGAYEDLGLEPEQLKKMVERYHQYGHLFGKL